MRKWWLAAAGTTVAVLIVAGLIFHQLSSVVPAFQGPEYEACVERQEAAKSKAVDCKATETFGERTLRDPVSYWALWTMVFTGVLALAAVLEGMLIFDQISLARREFVATHRPKLRVRNINIRQVDGQPGAPTGSLSFPKIGGTLDGQFYVSNIGGTDARLKEVYLMFFASNYPLPMERPYEGRDGNQTVTGGWIPAGRSTPIIFDQVLETSDRIQDSFINPAETTVYAMGWIEYEDRQHRVWRTAFCRRYSPHDWRFIADADFAPDYENEE